MNGCIGVVNYDRKNLESVLRSTPILRFCRLPLCDLTYTDHVRRFCSFKHNASFVSRLPTIRRSRPLNTSAQLAAARARHADVNSSMENMGSTR